jgi:hypothetical protein
MSITLTLLGSWRILFWRVEPGCHHSFIRLPFQFGSYTHTQVSPRAIIRRRYASPSLWYRSRWRLAMAYLCHFGSSVRWCGTQHDAIFRNPMMFLMMWQTVNWLIPTSTANWCVVRCLSTSNNDFRSCICSSWPWRNAFTHRATVRYGNASSPHASCKLHQHSFALQQRATSILVQERCSNFVNMS